MKKIICFDLEGPLSPIDHALEVMKLIPDGRKVFEVISRYDDLLTLDNQRDYEPGNTLKLIAPFLAQCRITDVNLTAVSKKAILTEGAEKVILGLQKNKWKVFIISTSYEQHAFHIAECLNISKKDVFCTKFPLDKFGKALTEKELLVVDSAGDYIASDLYSRDLRLGKRDEEIKTYLDEIFWKVFPSLPGINRIFKAIRVMGGARKAEALKIISEKTNVPLQDMAVVGDSITDLKMLKAVKEVGGPSIVFNGNKYALPCGTVGICSTSLKDLEQILQKWEEGGRKAVKEFILKRGDPIPYQWLVERSEKELQSIIEIHQKFREIARGKETAKLG